MNESQVSLVGWVGSEVEKRETSSGAVASFRLACTPRYFRNNEWHDGQTSWFTVNAWRTLARNIEQSINKGDAVAVQGRVRVDSWTPEGEQQPRLSWTVEATFVGHDLNRGTSRFAKPVRAAVADPAENFEQESSVGDSESQLSDDTTAAREPAA